MDHIQGQPRILVVALTKCNIGARDFIRRNCIFVLPKFALVGPPLIFRKDIVRKNYMLFIYLYKYVPVLFIYLYIYTVVYFKYLTQKVTVLISKLTTRASKMGYNVLFPM